MISSEALLIISRLKMTGQANVRVAGLHPKYNWEVRASFTSGHLRLIVERTITTIPIADDNTVGRMIDHVLHVLRNNAATIVLQNKPAIVCTEASYVPATVISLVRHSRAQVMWSVPTLQVSGLIAKRRGAVFESTIEMNDKSYEFEVPAHQLDDHVSQLRKLLPLAWQPVEFERNGNPQVDHFTVDQLVDVYESGMKWRDCTLVTNHAGDVEIHRNNLVHTVSGTLDLGQEVFIWHGYDASVKIGAGNGVPLRAGQSRTLR